mmetsp:Transcript_11545/g.37919  ORF Transcript_11545/g.37919 Transcript_11545/m.37919 type:complete len:97 (+) Transcript_11545:20-310(+)
MPDGDLTQTIGGLVLSIGAGFVTFILVSFNEIRKKGEELGTQDQFVRRGPEPEPMSAPPQEPQKPKRKKRQRPQRSKRGSARSALTLRSRASALLR